MDAYDVVIGSRYVDGGGTKGCTLVRKVISRSANLLARFILGLTARDCTAGFRCYRRSALEQISIEQILSDGYSFLIELLYLCQQRGCRIGEIPIIFEKRQRGASKISKREIFLAVNTLIRLKWNQSPVSDTSL